MMRYLAICATFLLVACTGVPLNEQSNYDVCQTYTASSPMGAAERVGYGIVTLGISELDEASKRSKHEKARQEMARRGIDDCSVEGLATFECNKIYSDSSSADSKQCVLNTTNTIASRISADEAKSSANAAAYRASQQKPNYNDRYLPKY